MLPGDYESLPGRSTSLRGADPPSEWARQYSRVDLRPSASGVFTLDDGTVGGYPAGALPTRTRTQAAIDAAAASVRSIRARMTTSRPDGYDFAETPRYKPGRPDGTVGAYPASHNDVDLKLNAQHAPPDVQASVSPASDSSRLATLAVVGVVLALVLVKG